MKGTDVGKLAALYVKDRRMLRHCEFLVINNAYMIAVFERGVVVERSETAQAGANGRLADPPIEVNHVRMVFLDNL